MPDIDITTHIKAIESLKCALLTDMAALYENMRKPTRPEEREEPLAGLLISLYRLAGQLGISPAQLDDLAVERLRHARLSGDRAADTHLLLQYLNARTGIQTE